MFSTKLCSINGFSSSTHLFLKSFKRVLPSLSHGKCTATNTLEAQCKCKPQKQVCKTVLKHFDAQYSEELGEQWSSARDVLLNPLSWQYGVLLNRFSDLTNLKQCLTELGYTNLLPQTHPESPYQTAPIPLQCFIHRDPVRIPTQSHHPGWLKQYYLLNAASLLPVLSLNVKEGERVLDLCAAPGGKSLAILQTATPGFLHCNEVDQHRHDWLLKTLESYVPPTLRRLLSVTRLDGRSLGSMRPGAYDKMKAGKMKRRLNREADITSLERKVGVWRPSEQESPSASCHQRTRSSLSSPLSCHTRICVSCISVLVLKKLFGNIFILFMYFGARPLGTVCTTF
ncbi:tRNA (cytosine(34)-C(5))-methyltransferase, mitochondrial isoform X2 [Puntigrus tetrazona]|uniref:tRNA (cytosine(34)-C(5))-methyltransferase, mitochondrial isoform X2 n=1 Tax=Puntigrus tetrazona TaxID=1606681 RepID=UPI001C8A8867|nr:tRNA (cytosine(34)-C(5))-methyltransferase, mitochondrial isoform X2 [Puntigrus tetrazona]